MNVTQLQFCFLKHLTRHGTIAYDDWRHLDQRPIAGLHKRGLLILTASFALKISARGTELVLAYGENPRTRKNVNAKTFRIPRRHAIA